MKFFPKNIIKYHLINLDSIFQLDVYCLRDISVVVRVWLYSLKTRY